MDEQIIAWARGYIGMKLGVDFSEESKELYWLIEGIEIAGEDRFKFKNTSPSSKEFYSWLLWVSIIEGHVALHIIKYNPKSTAKEIFAIQEHYYREQMNLKLKLG